MSSCSYGPQDECRWSDRRWKYRARPPCKLGREAREGGSTLPQEEEEFTQQTASPAPFSSWVSNCHNLSVDSSLLHCCTQPDQRAAERYTPLFAYVEPTFRINAAAFFAAVPHPLQMAASSATRKTGPPLKCECVEPTFSIKMCCNHLLPHVTRNNHERRNSLSPPQTVSYGLRTRTTHSFSYELTCVQKSFCKNYMLWFWTRTRMRPRSRSRSSTVTCDWT
jgi:hypothetical protein